MKNRVLGSALRTGVTRLLALAVLVSLVACAGTAGTETVSPEDVPVVTLADDSVIAEGVVEPARWVELSFDRTTTAVDVLVEEGDTGKTEPSKPKRFHGTATLDPTRVGRDASRIADEVIAHLSGLIGSKVQVTIEIEAEIPDGAPEQVVRTVTENSRTLKFTSQGFETE